MKFLFTHLILLIITCHNVFPQGSNANTRNKRYISPIGDVIKESKFVEQKKSISISDSTFLISGRVLMNIDSDLYKITFGLSEQGKTVMECSNTLDTRINQFKEAVKEIGIQEEDIFIDITTQYPIYGYDIEKKTATQQLEGYEINRNIVISYESGQMTGKLISIAAQQNIHDAVKVDYLISDIGKVYDQLFEEAVSIINRKKKMYLAATGLKIKEGAMIYSEQFQFVSPNDLSRSYQAYESSDIEYLGYRSRKFKEEERKKTTVYYDELNYSGFDKYINADKVEVGLQVIFELQIKYEKEK